MLDFDPGAYLNEEYIGNQETLKVNSTNRQKKVTLYDSSGNEVVMSVSSAGSIVTGTVTVTTAGTAVQITAASTPCKGVWVSGDTVAGVLLSVGDSGVVANVSGQKGIIVIPGNNPVFIPVNNLNLLWVDAATNGGKLAYAYLV